jgi:hypothetical protein
MPETGNVTIDYDNYATISTKAVFTLMEVPTGYSDLANTAEMSFVC